jgi:hypothetical protein
MTIGLVELLTLTLNRKGSNPGAGKCFCGAYNFFLILSHAETESDLTQNSCFLVNALSK